MERDFRQILTKYGGIRPEVEKGGTPLTHSLLAAASRVPLFFHPRATIPKAYGNHLRTTNCSKVGCEQRQTYTATELAGVLSERVGRTVKFDALVVSGARRC